MSQVIYARVPQTLKEAADAYAESRGATLTAAVVDLLGRGLAAVSDEQSIAQLQLKLAETKAECAQLQARLQAAGSELTALDVVAQRSGQVVAKCPSVSCGRDVTGYDLLAVGRCRDCGESLSGLLAPAMPASGIDQTELLLLIGALGALVGVAWLATRTG